MKLTLVFLAVTLFIAGCGDNSQQSTSISTCQTITAGIYYNPTSEYVAVNLEGMPRIDRASTLQKTTAITTAPGIKAESKVLALVPGDTINPSVGSSTQTTIVGCFDPVELDSNNSVTVCYDSDDLKSVARALSANQPEMLMSINDLLGDTGQVNMVVTHQSGADAWGYYDGDKHLAVVQYHDQFTILMMAAHELGHAVIDRVRGSSTPLWLNEALAVWAGVNFLNLMYLDVFDTGTLLYAAPLGGPGYTRLYAMAQLMNELKIISPKQALMQPDFLKALTCLDEQAFARLYWQRYQQYLPPATNSQYVGPYGAIKITGNATVSGNLVKL
jgi:hypothetical protein